MTPPTLNDNLNSSRFASKPVVRIEGAAGPAPTVATRTDVAIGVASSSFAPQPAMRIERVAMIEAEVRMTKSIGRSSVKGQDPAEDRRKRLRIRARRAVRARRSA